MWTDLIENFMYNICKLCKNQFYVNEYKNNFMYNIWCVYLNFVQINSLTYKKAYTICYL